MINKTATKYNENNDKKKLKNKYLAFLLRNS